MRNPNVEVHIITYNEEIMLPFTIAHYKRMFGSSVEFIIHDNGSTDHTISIANQNRCLVKSFTTEGMNDTVHRMIKSEAVMQSKADWIICIDCDEECMINLEDLEYLDSIGINIVEFQGWDIFDNKQSPWEASEFPRGCQSPGYSKPVLLKPLSFKEVEFGAGAHNIERIIPIEGGKVKWSHKEYNLLHYKHWSPIWHLNRSHELGVRQSQENLNKGYSTHFGLPDTIHTQWFNDHFAVSDFIQDKHI